MTSFRQNLIDLLAEMKGSGKFAFVHSVDFFMPGLEVANIGNVSFPLSQDQAQLLIDQAKKAPFGLGAETVYDETVRSGWEIDANQIKFKNPKWNKFLNLTLKKVKEELGLEDTEISASLYKLLIYEKGDFFLPHKDTEKEKGMFGTMVVELPSEHQGGALKVRYGNEEVIADFSGVENLFQIHSTAFYADCEHEVEPLKSGYRICLTYNLIREKAIEGTQLITVSQQAEAIADVLKEENKNTHLEPFIILLGHQYTPENFDFNTLKLNDRYKAAALLEAADLADCYASLCLVTSFKTGTPVYDGYYGDPDFDETEMDEVLDEWLEIEHWRSEKIPKMKINFEEADLIATFNMDEDEPLIKESTGYMGNYGPDVEYWYHYGAVVIWPKRTNTFLLRQTDKESLFNWINYFNQNKNFSKSEKNAINISLEFSERDMRLDHLDFNHVADWLIAQADFGLLSRLSLASQQFYFEKITADKWMELFELITPSEIEHFIRQMMESPQIQNIGRLIEVVGLMFLQNDSSELAKNIAGDITNYIEKGYEESKVKAVSRRLNVDDLNGLLLIEKYFTFDAKHPSIILSNSTRAYENKVLIPFLLASKSQSALYQSLFSFVYHQISSRVDNRPMEPQDSTRFFPLELSNQHILNEIKDFMLSPTEMAYDFKRNKNEREVMADAIYDFKLDLSTQIIKKGSPHILRLTKTKASYQNALKEWLEDCEVLELLNQLKQ